MLTIPIKPFSHAKDLPLPRYATSGSAGADLFAAVKTALILKPFERVLIPCGFALALPCGYEAQVRPRSGLALKKGITVLNAPGTIDTDFRGEISALIINLSQQDFTINRADRIAQLVIARYEQACWHEAEKLDASARGSDGFGSTGV